MYTVPLNLELFCINFPNGSNNDSFAYKPAHLRDNGIVSWCCFVNKRQGIWSIDETGYEKKRAQLTFNLLHKSLKKNQNYWNTLNPTHTHKLTTNFIRNTFQKEVMGYWKR